MALNLDVLHVCIVRLVAVAKRSLSLDLLLEDFLGQLDLVVRLLAVWYFIFILHALHMLVLEATCLSIALSVVHVVAVGGFLHDIVHLLLGR